MGNGWSRLLVELVLVGFSDDIFAQAQGYVLGMRHRHDAGCFDGAQAPDQIENAVKLLPYFGRLGGGDLDTGEMGKALDVFGGKCHFRDL